MVHVPGIWVTVDVLPPKIILGVTTPAKPGGRKVKLQVAGGVCVETGLIIERVVWFKGFYSILHSHLIVDKTGEICNKWPSKFII